MRRKLKACSLSRLLNGNKGWKDNHTDSIEELAPVCVLEEEVEGGGLESVLDVLDDVPVQPQCLHYLRLPSVDWLDG